LIALNQRIQLVQMQQPETAQLNEMQEMVAGLIADLRRLIHALRPIYLEDLGLVPALQVLTQEVGEGAGLEIAFESTGRPRRLEPEVELALYRIAQEALSNVVRHAGASTAEMSLAFRPETVTLTVGDNGIGFGVPESPAELAPQGHFGLLGIHERAELIGARLALDSQPGKGTRLEVVVFV
jgi:signal transduction histidine kinase